MIIIFYINIDELDVDFLEYLFKFLNLFSKNFVFKAIVNDIIFYINKILK